MNQNQPTAHSDAASGPDPATASRCLVPIDGPSRDDLLAALCSATDTTLAELACPRLHCPRLP